MTLTDFSIKRPVFAWIIMFVLIFFGVLAYFNMEISENPDVDYPTVYVSYEYPGASPEVVENDILIPAESALVAMQGIRVMYSSASRGSGRISLEFDLGKNIDLALQEVNTLVSFAQSSLPDVVNLPTVYKSNVDDRPIMYVGISSPVLKQREIMVVFRDQIQDRLTTVEGVSEVNPFGYQEPILRVDLNPSQLKRYQLTADDVVQAITLQHVEQPAGLIEKGESETSLRIMGEMAKVEEFKRLRITRRGGGANYATIRLEDVANVTEGLENLRQESRVQGSPGISMGIRKQRGVNAAATGQAIRKRIDELNKEYRGVLELGVNFDSTTFIAESIDELVFTLALSAGLTSIVCWLFIGSFSATLNVLLAIPTAIIGSLIFLYLLGFSLNTFSLLGLTLSIGIVVDDAIVMLENITRYMQKGYGRVAAAFKGAREISFAVLATSVALIAIFVPIAFLKGIEGRFFLEFAVALSIAVALSSLEALTLAPMRCSQFLVLQKRRSFLGRAFERFIMRITNAYVRVLTTVIRYKKSTVVLSLLLFGGSMYGLRYIPTELAPDQDRGVIFISARGPEGTNLHYMRPRMLALETMLLNHPMVNRVIVRSGGRGGGQGNTGFAVVVLKPYQERSQGQMEIADELRDKTKDIEGVQFFVNARSGSAFSGRRGNALEFTLFGPDAEKQKELYQRLKAKMDADSDITGTRSDDLILLPEWHIVPDRKMAARYGVEVSEINRTVNSMIQGVIAAQYTSGGRRFDIVVQSDLKYKEDIAQLKNFEVRNYRGELVPLSKVVKIEKGSGPLSLYRENRARGLRVDAGLKEGAIYGTVVSRIQNWAAEILPPAYVLKFEKTPTGELQKILLIMFMGLLVAYLVLAIQFNSFADPAIIFLAVPFALMGALLALFLGGETLNVFSGVGILLTLGIVKKNSILIVEFTNQLRDQGLALQEALVTASKERLRPILMTNLATLAAAIPPAMALGPGNETRIPMALTVIGGVSLSLLVTLLVVPAAFAWVKPKRILIVEDQ